MSTRDPKNRRQSTKADDAKANTLTVEASPGKERECIMAELGMSSIAKNASTSRNFATPNFGTIDLSTSLDVLRGKANKVLAGDLSEVETTLIAQAVALDTIFNEMARRAAANMGEFLNATETYLRLALKAQSQCRTTLETLAEIKNPRSVAFVKQANIAHGPQQVNNETAMASASPARAGNSQNPQNKLLESTHGKRLDTATAGTAGSGDPTMATLEPLDRPKKS